MTGDRRRWAGGLALLAAALGPSLTVGQGVLVLVAAAAAAATRHPSALLAAAAAAALGAGHGARAPDGWWLAGVAGLLIHGVLRRREPAIAQPWRPALPIVAGAGLVGLALLALPHGLPIPEVVVPRTWPDSVAGMSAVAATAAVLAGLVRVPPAQPLLAGLALAGLVPLGEAAWVASRTAGTDNDVILVDGARSARRLGLPAWSARLVERALLAAQARGELGRVRQVFDEDTREGDLARRRAAVLLAGARALEAAGGAPTDVDVLVQRALRATPAGQREALLEPWPGRARVVAAARRARVDLLGVAELERQPPGSRSGAQDCFGGTWCLLGAEIPAFRGHAAQGPVRLRLRLVAEPVSDVTAHLELSWRRWRSSALLRGAGHAVGDELLLEVPVDDTGAVSGDNEVWLQLLPADRGHPLRLERLPGIELMVGHAIVP